MSREESKLVAQEALRMIDESQRDQQLLKSGLPDPATANGPITFMGVTFFPHPADACWRMYPARNEG